MAWGLAALTGVLAGSSLGRGEFRDGLAFHQVWEVLFVAAFYVVRWAPGAILLSLPVAVPPIERIRRRLRARRRALSS